LSAQSDGEREWAETLEFGIDSQVESLLPQIEQAGVVDLDQALLDRFDASRSDTLRVSIIEFFERRESDALVPSVRNLLLAEERPPEQVVRASAAYLSARSAEVDEALLDLYEDFADDSSVLSATVAIEAIGSSGAESAVDRLSALYEEQQSSDIKASILRALGHTGSDAALPLLTRVAEDEFEQSALRHYATESIGRIASEESVELLESLLSSEDSVLRAYATLALGFYPEETTSGALSDALLDSFWRVRVAALEGLAEQQNTSSVPAIAFKARRDPERPVRIEAISALGRIRTDEAIEALTEIAANVRSGEVERITALQELIEFDAGQFVELYEEVIADEWEREGSRVFDAIGKGISTNGDPRLEDIYVRLLEHPNFVIRVYGIRGIGNASLSGQADRLKSIADASSGLLRTSAVAALDKMGIAYDPDAEVEETDPDNPEGSETAEDSPSADEPTDDDSW
jgi:HEAT repeat protein